MKFRSLFSVTGKPAARSAFVGRLTWCLTSTLLFSIATPTFATTCEVSIPNRTTPKGAPSPPGKSFGWFGNAKLAAIIPADGNWEGMGPNHNYGDKFWWWKEGYSVRLESIPNLTVTATQLDQENSPTVTPFITNARGTDGGWDAILVGMEFPKSGCWEVVGKTTGSEIKIILMVGSK